MNWIEVFRQDVASSLSELWYRVAGTRPRLSPHAQLTRHQFGEHGAYIIEDPASSNYYRLSESAYLFVGLLDGTRTVQEAWDACVVQLGDEAPTQRECVEVLSRLQYYGQLAGEQPLAPDMITLRRREAASRTAKRRIGGGLSMVIPLINPEPFLERTAYLWRAVYSRTGLVLWSVLVIYALYCVLTNLGSLTSQFNGALDPANIIWIGVVFTCLRAWHELGHAAACKAMGVRCTEMGLMLVAVLFPFPYCDASGAWRLPQVWRRVVISAGGMLFESVPAAIAAIVWSHMEEPGLARTLLYNTMVISGFTTLVFNINPLMRYDGYYILSDITGSANLAQRAVQMWKFLFQKVLFRVRNARPPSVRSGAELTLLLIYGALAFPYRMLVLGSIVLILWSKPQYLTIGVVIAVVALFVWVIWPILKGFHFLFTAPMLVGRRARAVGIVFGFLLALALGLGLVPAPSAGYAGGVIEPLVQEPLRNTEQGFIDAVHVTVGQAVQAGDLILTLRNAEVQTTLFSAQALVERARADYDNSIDNSEIDRILSKHAVDFAQAGLDRARRQAQSLEVRATVAGRVINPPGSTIDFQDLPGRFLERGTLVGFVATTENLVVRCTISDRDQAYVFRGATFEEASRVPAAVRVKGDAGEVVPASVSRVAPAATRAVIRRALTSDAGGDTLLDPSDPKGETSLVPHFLVELAPVAPRATWQPGLRARVRFDLPNEPLASQWLRRFRQYLGEKISE